MTQEQVKNALISLLIGACISFFSVLFQELATFLKSHSTEIMSGATAAYYYIAKSPKV